MIKYSIKSAIKEELYWLILILTIGMIIGFLLENITLMLVVALSFYIFFHFLQVRKVLNWFAEGKISQSPSTHGVWSEFIHQALNSEKKNKKRKKRLSTLLNRFNDVLAAMPDAIVIIDEYGGIEWFNESALHLLKLHHDRDIGRHITHSLEEKSFIDYYSRKNYDHSINIYWPTEADLYLNIRIAAYGKKKYLLSARDITRMQQLEGVRSLFVANVSHELRTPLTVISGYLELLAATDHHQVDEAIQALQPIFAQMSQQADRMTNLLDDLLMLSNLENQQETESLNETICVAEMMNDIYRDAQMLKREDRYTLSCDIDKSLAIKGNAKELHSAFNNLVTNALRYTPAGGKIKISWVKKNNTACFSVQDNGIGIASSHINRITERFYRVDKGRSRSTGGTGLGLAIVKHVLYKHDAVLKIDSALAQGSCFSCIFPEHRIEYSANQTAIE
jgi:two-component system phosphate regulon sensor histidine kinase PhoR